MKATTILVTLLALLLASVIAQETMEIQLNTPTAGTAAEEDTWVYYWYDVMESSTDAYTVYLTPTSGAVQLYVRYLNVPSMDASDFYDTLADNSGSYSVTLPACAGDGPWYFGVYASTAPASWSITVVRTSISLQPLAFDTPVSSAISNQQWKFFYFDAPDNNSFVGVSLNDPSQTAGATALYLRPMMCPTMFQNMRAATSTGVQTATVSCTETMGGRWFVAVGSMSGAAVSFTLRATQGTYTDIQAGAITAASVQSPTGFNSYRIRVPQASALQLSLTANTAYRSLRTYLNLDTCSTNEQQMHAGGFTTAGTQVPAVNTALYPVNAGTWYIAVTGDCTPASACSYAVSATPQAITCAQPTATTAPFCAAAGLEWTTGNYNDVQQGDTQAQVSYNRMLSTLSTPPSDECAYVMKMAACAQSLPKCGVVGLPTKMCRPLCIALNQCLGTTTNCDDTNHYGRGTECSAPARYSAAGRAVLSVTAAVAAAVVAVVAVLGL